VEECVMVKLESPEVDLHGGEEVRPERQRRRSNDCRDSSRVLEQKASTSARI
jgi:hypothetical protein